MRYSPHQMCQRPQPGILRGTGEISSLILENHFVAEGPQEVEWSPSLSSGIDVLGEIYSSALTQTHNLM